MMDDAISQYVRSVLCINVDKKTKKRMMRGCVRVGRHGVGICGVHNNNRHKNKDGDDNNIKYKQRVAFRF